MAHYAAFLKLMSETWWLKRVGDRSLQDLCRFIDPEYCQFLGMPRRALSLIDNLSIARVILEDDHWDSPVPLSRHWDEQQEAETSQLTLVDHDGRPVRPQDIAAENAEAGAMGGTAGL
ncbi:hypothetical protein CDD83_4713 [Cordyceps sp. RAO-2017]|nr:hypothetical protein CDD83_4713 [Cordyceps sp. RAO-2017]